MNPELKPILSWYRTGAPLSPQLCATRDVFQARLDRFYRELLQSRFQNDAAALIASVLGEIGNNSFDHNLGQWQDQPGCWFQHDLSDLNHFWAVIADRGQGILASLKRVLPELADDQEALQVAYEKRVSGRAPEQRGNGLKYVRSVLNGHAGRGLFVASGTGHAIFGMAGPSAENEIGDIHELKQNGGTFNLLVWNHTS